MGNLSLIHICLMGVNEQVPGEELTEGQLVKVYLVEVRRTTRGPQVMVSRCV